MSERWHTHPSTPGVAVLADREYDDERRHVAEPHGCPVVAFLPRRCRNGKWRWLRWLERHSDGTYTLCRGG